MVRVRLQKFVVRMRKLIEVNGDFLVVIVTPDTVFDYKNWWSPPLYKRIYVRSISDINFNLKYS